MRSFIALLKIFGLITFTLLIYLVYAPPLVLIKLGGLRYESWRNRCMKAWGKGILALLSVKVTVEGIAPQPPFLLVSNHLSYIDIPVYASLLDATFVSKAEVKQWPVLGFMAKTIGIIFIDRTRKRDVPRVNRKISAGVHARQGILLFPEGRTSAGSEVLPFRPALLEYPAAEGMEVSCAALHYQTGEKDPPALESVCWWREIPLHKHLFLLASNRSITVRVRFSDRPVRSSDRKILARELRDRVEHLFIPMADKHDIETGHLVHE